MTGPQFETVVDGSDCILIARGELDLACMEELRAVLRPLAGRVVVDLSEVTFLDSSAMGVLVEQYKRLTADGGGLVIRSPHDLPRQVLKLTGLGDWIVDD